MTNYQQLDTWMKTQNDEGRVLVAPRLLSEPESWQMPQPRDKKKLLHDDE